MAKMQLGGGRPTVLAAIADHEWRAHVRSLLDPWAVLTVVPNVRSLHEETPDILLWHLGSAHDADDTCVAAVRRFRVHSARSVVVAYCRISVPTAPLLVMAGRVGIDRLLVRDHDDLRTALRRELEEHRAAAVSRYVLTRLAPPDGAAWRVVSHCVLRTVGTVLTVEALACELGVNRKTLHNWLRAAGLPSAERVIGWTRLLVVAALLEVSSGSVASIAARVGFTTESVLRGMLARYAGMRPCELRQRDGFARLLATFRDATSRAWDGHSPLSAVHSPSSLAPRQEIVSLPGAVSS